jgi:hypothetical protein
MEYSQINQKTFPNYRKLLKLGRVEAGVFFALYFTKDNIHLWNTDAYVYLC